MQVGRQVFPTLPHCRQATSVINRSFIHTQGSTSYWITACWYALAFHCAAVNRTNHPCLGLCTALGIDQHKGHFPSYLSQRCYVLHLAPSILHIHLHAICAMLPKKGTPRGSAVLHRLLVWMEHAGTNIWAEQKYCANCSRQEPTVRSFREYSFAMGHMLQTAAMTHFAALIHLFHCRLSHSFPCEVLSFLYSFLSCCSLFGVTQVGRQVFPHTTTHCQQATSFYHYYSGVHVGVPGPFTALATALSPSNR